MINLIIIKLIKFLEVKDVKNGDWAQSPIPMNKSLFYDNLKKYINILFKIKLIIIKYLNNS